MKRSTKIISAVVLSIGLATGATAYAKYKGGFGDGHSAYMLGYISSELELDASQKQQLELLSSKILAVKTDFKAQSKPMHQEVRQLLSTEKFDQQQALNLLNNKIAVINQQAPEVLIALGNFLDGLNPEQKAEVLAFIDQKHAKHGAKY